MVWGKGLISFFSYGYSVVLIWFVEKIIDHRYKDLFLDLNSYSSKLSLMCFTTFINVYEISLKKLLWKKKRDICIYFSVPKKKIYRDPLTIKKCLWWFGCLDKKNEVLHKSLQHPLPHSLSIIHSVYNIYSYISISLKKDQSFFPYAAETYNIYHRL